MSKTLEQIEALHQDINAYQTAQEALTEKIGEIHSGLDAMKARLDELGEEKVPVEQKITDMEAWVRDIESKVNTRSQMGYDGASAPILQAIPDRDRKQVMVAEAIGQSKGKRHPARKNPVGYAGMCLAWLKDIAARGCNERPEYASQLREERDKLYEAFGPGLVTQAAWAETTNVGTEVILTPVEAEVLRLIQDNSLIRRLPIRTVTMVSKTHQFPDLTSDVTVTITGEGATIADSMPATFLGQKALTAVKYTGLAKMGAEVVQDAAISVVDFTFELIAEQIGRLESKEALEGDGTNNTGVSDAIGVNTIGAAGANGDEITYNDTVDAIFKQEEQQGRENAAFVFHPLIAAKLLKLVDSQNRPIFEFTPPGAGFASAATSGVGLLQGFPVFTFSGIKNRTKGTGTTLKNAYFGNWSKFIMGDLLGLQFDTDPFSLFANDQIQVRVKKRTGLVVGVPKAFTVIQDLISA